jgi:hypothetical protein
MDNEAMKRIISAISNTRGGDILPSDEYDILIGWDFNANRFDNKKEKFRDDLEKKDWDVLASDSNYPATRLSGVPY